MAQNQTKVTCAGGAWTQITNANVSSITYQALNGPVYIRFTTDETTPTETTGLRYESGEGELNKAISDLTNLVGADRVWAKPVVDSHTILVQVDHA